MKGTHVSVDIEACGEIVLSIGACEFDPATGESGRSVHVVPSIADQLRAGLRPDAAALVWLLKQSDSARAAIADAQGAASTEFEAFRAWWPSADAWCWAYPTSFDLPVIAAAMRAFDKRPPWRWTRTMDGRTLWQLAIERDSSMANIEKSAIGVEHHAIADARQQAFWYAKYLRAVTS